MFEILYIQYYFFPWTHCFWFNALRPSQQFFSHGGIISFLPGLNQYLAADNVCCSRTQHSDSASSKSLTSNPSIPSLTLYQLSQCTPVHSLTWGNFPSWQMQCFFLISPYELQHEISNNVLFATKKASDQPAHMRSLIRAFASRLNSLWVLNYWLNIIWSF